MAFESLKEWKDIFVDKVSDKYSELYEKDDEKEIEYKNQEIIEKLNQYFGYKAISKINIIQNFEEYTVESKKNKIEKKITKKKFFKEITNIKQPKLQKALLKLDKTLFKSE